MTPFYEWKEYLKATHSTQPISVDDFSSVIRKKNSDFAFVEELSALLQFTQKQPLVIERTKEELASLQVKAFKALEKECPEISKADLHILLTKACLLQLAQIKEEVFSLLPDGYQWLEMSVPERALVLYRCPSYALRHEELPEELLKGKNIS